MAFSLSPKDLIKYSALFFAILIAIGVVAQGAVLYGAMVLGLLGLPFIALSLYNYRFGIIVLFGIGTFMFVIGRILRTDLPFGVLFDLLIVLIFISIALKSKENEKLDLRLNDPITISNLVFYLYFALQVLNPNATNIMAWVSSIRQYTLLLFFFVMITYFNKKLVIQRFIYVWLFVAMIVALYGLKQEFIGLANFEWDFIYATPDRYFRYFNWGHMRTFSILSDPSAFGLFMGFSGLATLILSFGPFNFFKKAILAFMTLAIFASMIYSGTRTAYAMVVVGIVFFVVLNIKNVKVLAASIVFAIVFLVLMFGPFYSGPIIRLRSTFNLSEDASMNVRDNTRVMYQYYVQHHPFGGGVNTTGNIGLKYSPSHPLAGYPPDSGFLRTALELGWIGLILVLIIDISVVVRGIKNHYSLKDEKLKIFNMAFMVPFFGLTIANYAQDAMFQKPVLLPVIATYALMIKIKEIEDEGV
ncbi:MAG: O-antigen ligase family protein [Cyclobacteriaceae bacterium]|nr:O-antigen ligase family protein [Cyclobacteriaceae bacterium]